MADCQLHSSQWWHPRFLNPQIRANHAVSLRKGAAPDRNGHAASDVDAQPRSRCRLNAYPEPSWSRVARVEPAAHWSIQFGRNDDSSCNRSARNLVHQRPTPLPRCFCVDQHQPRNPRKDAQVWPIRSETKCAVLNLPDGRYPKGMSLLHHS